MTDSNAPLPEPDDTLGPNDVIGGGNAVAGGNPAKGASEQVQAPTPQQPQQGGQGSDDVIGAGSASSNDGSNTVKDPEQWVTGDEPMTGAQRSYLETLAQEAGETLSADLTKAQASEQIDRLQSSTGRGQS